MRRFSVVVVLGSLLLGACAPQEETTTPGETGGDASPAASCERDSLNLLTPGQLTVGTDNPAYPPWFEGGTAKDSPWKINDPSTGEGFESAVAYAVAERLGFTAEEVTWVEVPFNQSFKPGPKDFDFDINQISFKPQRDQAVDFSDSYYDVNQALVANAGTPITEATSIADLTGYKLGAPIGTTSYDVIVETVQTEEDPGVYDTLNDAISALENGQIDGVVVDLPTAFFIVAAQLKNGAIVGQFPAGAQQEYFGMVFEEGNTLRDCVNEALAELRADGTLDALQQEWLADKAEAPVFQ